MNRTDLGFNSGATNGPMSHIWRSFVSRPSLRIGRRTEGAAAPHRIRFRAPRRRGAITPDRLRQDGLI